jgi:hypothetical protein
MKTSSLRTLKIMPSNLNVHEFGFGSSHYYTVSVLLKGKFFTRVNTIFLTVHRTVAHSGDHSCLIFVERIWTVAVFLMSYNCLEHPPPP